MKKKVVKLNLKTRRPYYTQIVVNSFSWVHELNTIKAEEIIKRIEEDINEYQRVMHDSLNSIKITIKKYLLKDIKDDIEKGK